MEIRDREAFCVVTGVSNGVADELCEWARGLDNEGSRYRAIVDGLTRMSPHSYAFHARDDHAWQDFIDLLRFIGDPYGAQSCAPQTKSAARRYVARWDS